MKRRWQKRAEIIHEAKITKWPVNSDEDIRFVALALAGEVGELCNLVKKQWRGDKDPGTRRAELEGEMADVRIYLYLLERSLRVDLDEACEDKMKVCMKRWPECGEAVRAEEKEERQ